MVVEREKEKERGREDMETMALFCLRLEERQERKERKEGPKKIKVERRILHALSTTLSLSSFSLRSLFLSRLSSSQSCPISLEKKVQRRESERAREREATMAIQAEMVRGPDYEECLGALH